jgi:hypothetical protein
MAFRFVLVVVLLACICQGMAFVAGKDPRTRSITKVAAITSPIEAMFQRMTLSWNEKDCTTVASYVTEDVQILQNGRIKTGRSVFMKMCQDWAKDDYSVSTVAVGINKAGTKALWHKSYTTDCCDKVQYNKFTQVHIVGPTHSPMIDFLELFWEIHPAPAAQGAALTQSYSVQYFKNCNQWLSFYSPSCTFEYPQGTLNYTQVQEICPSSWAGIGSFMWAMSKPIMTNNVDNVPNPEQPNRFLTTWNMNQHNVTNNAYTVNSGFGIYELSSDNLIVSQLIYYVDVFA